VTADTSALGGTTTQVLYDDGTHGDVTAGDGVYSYSLTIPGGQAATTYTVNFKVSDSQLRSATTSAAVIVQSSTVAASNTVLSASTTNALAGTNVIFSAAVTGNQAGAPTGMVTFKDGTTVLGTGTIASGAATYSTTGLALGTHTITAVYGGDATYPGSTSGSVTVTISPVPVPDFTLTLANTAILTSANSHTGTTTVYVAMVNGFNSPVSLSCSGLPAASRCTFSPATLTTATAPLGSVLTVGVDGAMAAPHSMPFGRGEGVLIGLGLLGLPLMLRRKSRKRFAGMALGVLMLCGLLTSVSGCGSGGGSTASGSSAITVTATGGSVTHTATFTLNVQ